MSSHTYITSNESTMREQKGDGARKISAPALISQQSLSAGDPTYKNTLQEHLKAAMSITRPIAPAPSVVAQAGASLGLTRLPAGSSITQAQILQSHNLVNKVREGQQLLNQNQHVSTANTIGSSSTPAQPITLQQTPVNLHHSVPMASLIRSANQSTQQQLAQLVSQQSQQVAAAAGQVLSHGSAQSVAIGQHVTTQPIAFTSHVPRGAAAASALSQPKPGSLATAVLRGSQPAAIQLSATVTPNTAHLGSVPAMAPRALIPMRPGNPVTPPARPHSPAVTTVLHGHQDTHRTVLANHPAVSTTTGTTVQITIQQPRTMSEVSTRPATMLSQLQLPKQNIAGQPLLQQAHLAQAQLAQAQHLTHPHKVVMTQASAVVQPGQVPATKLVAPSQPPFARTQKIVVAHPAAVSCGTFAQTSTTVTAAASGKSVMAANFNKKIMMTSQTISTLPTQTVTSPGALNLAQQQLARSQKVIVSQVAPSAVHVGSSPSLHNISTFPKAGTISVATVTGSLTMSTNIPTANSASAIPVAKVPPQSRLLAGQQHHEIGREGIGSSLPPHITKTPGQPSSFLPQPRSSPISTAVTSVTVSQTESRPSQERVAGFASSTTFQSVPQTTDYNALIHSVYHPNLVYSQLSQGSVRPGVLAATGTQQTPNLAATLQGAQANVGSTGQPLRFNPMMVQSLSVPQYASSTDVGKSGFAGENTATLSNTASGLLSSVPQQQSPANSGTSPRPSILRKRTSDGSLVSSVKKNLLTTGLCEATASNPATDLSVRSSYASKSLPIDPSRENSQSSTDTATSSESTPQSFMTQDMRIKQELEDTIENGPATGDMSAPTVPNNMEESPRKRPRKQHLNATEDIQEADSTDDEVDQINSRAEIKKELEKYTAIQENDDCIDEDALSYPDEYIDEEGIRWVSHRQRPNLSLMNHYQCTWKPRSNHFLRHQDVKPKEERRPTVNELSNQKGVSTKASGWKMYHLASQLEDLVDNEKDVLSRLTHVQESIAPKNVTKQAFEDELSLIHELTQGNVQRCQLVTDQVEEAKSSMLKILDHKKRIHEIINKHHSKRPVKKKERT